MIKMNRIKYLSKLFTHPVFKIIGGLITLLGAYDLFIGQFIQRKFQNNFPILSDYIRLGWPWYIWIIILLSFFLFVFFEGGYKLIRQHTINPVLIKDLIKLRKEGISLWHEGKRCMSQESVVKWWEKHIDWKKRCVNVVRNVDESLAGEIDTLGIGHGLPFKDGISQDHNHKVWMQSAWNNRLDVVIKEIRTKKK